MAESGQSRFQSVCLWSAIPLVLILFSAAYWHGANQPIHASVPPQKTIHPNAFYTYRSAMRGANINTSALYWAINRTPRARPTPSCPVAPGVAPTPAPNAPAAAAPMAPSPAPVLQPNAAYYDEYELATLAEKRAFLQPYAGRLAQARRGLRYRCLVPRSGPDDCSVVDSLETLSRLLLLDGQVKELQKDWDGALNAYVDSLRVSVDLACGGGVDNQLHSAFQQLPASRGAWDVLRNTSAAEARGAALRLSAILDSVPSQADVLREQKYIEQVLWAQRLSEREWRSNLADEFSEDDPHDHHIDRMQCYTVSKPAVLAASAQAYDERIRSALKPYPQDHMLGPTILTFDNYWLCSEPCLSRALWEYPRAMNSLLCVALALRAWRLEHGSYPASLRALVPKYLSKLPADPFALKGTLRYARAGSRYVLYSVGPDCVDNRGIAVRRNTVNPGPWTNGDLVAGVTNADAPLPRALLRSPTRPLPHKITSWMYYPPPTTYPSGAPGPAPAPAPMTP